MGSIYKESIRSVRSFLQFDLSFASIFRSFRSFVEFDLSISAFDLLDGFFQCIHSKCSVDSLGAFDLSADSTACRQCSLQEKELKTCRMQRVVTTSRLELLRATTWNKANGSDLEVRLV